MHECLKDKLLTDGSYQSSDVTSMQVRSKFKGILRSMVTFAIWLIRRLKPVQVKIITFESIRPGLFLVARLSVR